MEFLFEKIYKNRRGFFGTYRSKISSKYKRTLLNDLEINIDSYISEHPNTTYKDLVENFGTPEDVSESFYESLSSDEIKKQQKLKKHIIICGGSGIIFQRTDTWQFLTAPGMGEC